MEERRRRQRSPFKRVVAAFMDIVENTHTFFIGDYWPSQVDFCLCSHQQFIQSHAAERQSRTKRSRKELPITLTDDSAIAAAAMIGDRRMPKNGYSAPAAIGTPAAL